MNTKYLTPPSRGDLWSAFAALTNTAQNESASSYVARDLLVYSHSRQSFDIGDTYKFDTRNRWAAAVIISHAINGGDDREFANYLKENKLTKVNWIEGRVQV